MGTITGKFHQNPLKTIGGVAETRLTAEKLLKGHNSSKNQLSMTSIEYEQLQVIGTITGKFHQNPLKTVGGVAETRLCLRTDGLTDGRTHYYSPLRLTLGDKNTTTDRSLSDKFRYVSIRLSCPKNFIGLRGKTGTFFSQSGVFT